MPVQAAGHVTLWRQSKVLPRWMKDYFQWHQRACKNITAGTNKWQDYDYLLFQCLEHDKKYEAAAD
jgi:hypothetical protein